MDENYDEDRDAPNANASKFCEPCITCGGTNYERNAGYLYCTECGLQSQAEREIANWDVFELLDENQHMIKSKKTRKITKAQREIIEKSKLMSSWEVYNIIYYGMVEQCMLLGTSEDFKLKALQLWTHYLKKLEAAFFDKQTASMPKLPIAFYNTDAVVFYDKQSKKIPSKNRSRSSRASSSIITTAMKKRMKAKLVVSNYNATISSQSEESLSAKSQPIQFSSHARKFMKRKCNIAKSHIQVHEKADSLVDVPCHKPIFNKRKIWQANPLIIHCKNLTALISIALNLSNSDFQLSDIVRFIREQRIYTTRVNIQGFFPDGFKHNVLSYWRGLLLHNNSDVVFDCTSRMGRFLGIGQFNMPNILQLCERYVKELCLPNIIMKWIERVYHLLPHCSLYESTKFIFTCNFRAMAYIIFVLKLIFGLDGTTEQELSKSAIKLNEKLQSKAAPEEVFVFSEWTKYIEIRKNILDEWKSKWNIDIELEYDDSDFSISKQQKAKYRQWRELFSELINDDDDSGDTETFENTLPPASLTPNYDYFKLLKENVHLTSIHIPKFMFGVKMENASMEYCIHPIKFKNRLRRNYNIHLRLKPAQSPTEICEVVPDLNYFQRPATYQVEHKLKFGLFKYNFVDEFIELDKTPIDASTRLASARKLIANIQEYSEQFINTSLPNKLFENQSEDDEEIDDDNDISDVEIVDVCLPHFQLCSFQYRTLRIDDEYDPAVENLPASLKWLLEICGDMLKCRTTSLLVELNNIESLFTFMKPLRKDTRAVQF